MFYIIFNDCLSLVEKKMLQVLSIFVAVSFCNLGDAADCPAQVTGRDLMCFDNKLIYVGCDEAFRLTQSGIVHVPPDATDRFCNGPCLLQTKLLLTCIEKIDSNYVFNNEATTKDIRNALDAGCSNTSTRGNFNVGNYVHGGLSNLARGSSNIGLFSTCWILGLCFWIANYH